MSCADYLVAGTYGKNITEDHTSEDRTLRYVSNGFVCTGSSIKRIMQFLEQHNCHDVLYNFLNLNGKKGYWISGFRKDKDGSHRIAVDLPALSSKGKLVLSLRGKNNQDLLDLGSALGIKLTSEEKSALLKI
jgi:hypothetical protein